MNKDTIYNKGFTLIEMIVSLVITGAVTMSILFIFNTTQQKFFQDNMHEEITNHCNATLNYITSILDSSQVKEIGPESNLEIINTANPKPEVKAYEITFWDNDRNCGTLNNEECTIYEITFNRTGLYVKNKKDGSRIDPFYLSFGANNFNSGDIQEGGLNLLNRYSINNFRITKLKSTDFRQRNINPRRLSALKKSSFNVCIDVLIENDKASTTKSYCQKVFNKTLYLWEAGSYSNQSEGQLSQF